MYCVILRSIVIARKNILLLIISPVLFLLDYIAFHYFAEIKLTRHMVSPIRPPYCDKADRRTGGPADRRTGKDRRTGGPADRKGPADRRTGGPERTGKDRKGRKDERTTGNINSVYGGEIGDDTSMY